jgi:3-hydroxyacyl-CoA dehydrogenase/enoyl-CoA hydratase/3-hydroxybutyryl-CoA epimerase
LPGAGGTQRLPRFVGLESALPILLEGGRLSQQAALDAGIVHALVATGEEIAKAETWLLSSPVAAQPWDIDQWEPEAANVVSAAIAPVRERILASTLGHYPAPLAILDCLEFGLPQPFDGAIRSEMAIFSHLIQRAEARNMIQTLFLGKTDYDRHARKGDMPAFVIEVVAAVKSALQAYPVSDEPAKAGFPGGHVAPVRTRARNGYWIDGEGADASHAHALLAIIGEAVAPFRAGRTAEELRLADYAIVREAGYPAYLGGPFTRSR